MPWLATRKAIVRPDAGRQFVDDVLGELAAHRFGPLAWVRFFGRSLVRSAGQIRIRPAAAIEVTALHLLAGAGGSRRWALASWWLCITHLGLLGERSSLGWPNRLTLLRALLPALRPDSRWTSLVALATDLADGRIARQGSESAFGAFADPIADGAFWCWLALRWESNRWLRWAPITLFAVSAAGISAAYFGRGRAIDYPRPIAVRYASAAAQILLTLRTLRSAGS
ncbi:CDP-alcohol phosphatidyltransferase family protein [bacterium]|nr:MAG: CDP-alcohol phosphatidyltransferase family protein [bacterium]